MFDILDRSAALPFFSDKREELIHLKSGEFSCYFNEGDRTIKHPVYVKFTRVSSNFLFSCVDAIMCLKRTEDLFKYELVISGTSNPNSLCRFYYISYLPMSDFTLDENQQIFKVQKIMKLKIYRINMNQDVCITWVDEASTSKKKKKR